jgi:hypothetical protein
MNYCVEISVFNCLGGDIEGIRAEVEDGLATGGNARYWCNISIFT